MEKISRDLTGSEKVTNFDYYRLISHSAEDLQTGIFHLIEILIFSVLNIMGVS